MVLTRNRFCMLRGCHVIGWHWLTERHTGTGPLSPHNTAHVRSNMGTLLLWTTLR